MARMTPGEIAAKAAPYIRSEYTYGVLKSLFINGVDEPVLLEDFEGSTKFFRADKERIAGAIAASVALLWVWNEPFLLRSHMKGHLGTDSASFPRVAVVIPSVWSRAYLLMRRHVTRRYRCNAAQVFVNDEARALAWLQGNDR